MRLVVVGDMHVKSSNLDESSRLIDWLCGISPNLPIIFMGDQLNDFGIARVECLSFWKKAISKLRQVRSNDIILLVGNHDKNHEGKQDFMTALFSGMRDQGVFVISEPEVLHGNHLFVPFIRKNNEFVEIVNSHLKYADMTVFCHQEFNGSKYENGFFAPHGVDPQSIIGTRKVISGHIHLTQWLGDRFFYVGTPRPLTKSDANQAKGIWLVDTEKDSSEFIETPHEVALPFRRIKVTEGSLDLATLKEESKNPERLYVDIEGSSEFVQRVLKSVKLKGVKTSTAFTDTIEIGSHSVKESEGIPKAFSSYAMKYFDKTDLGSTEIKAVLGVIHKYCPSLGSYRG